MATPSPVKSQHPDSSDISRNLKPYYFYILRCDDNSLYCGMTSNLEKRLKEHNSAGPRSAKYLRSRKPVRMVYSETFPDIKTAMHRELEVKSWTKSKKEALLKKISL